PAFGPRRIEVGEDEAVEEGPTARDGRDRGSPPAAPHDEDAHPRTLGTARSGPGDVRSRSGSERATSSALGGLRGDRAGEVRREPSGVALLQVGTLPVVAGHALAAVRRVTRAVELVVVGRVAHRVVERDLLARLDVAHRDDEHGADEPTVRIAGVVDE